MNSEELWVESKVVELVNDACYGIICGNGDTRFECLTSSGTIGNGRGKLLLPI